ncbi:host attachment protein [Sulfurovum sp.]|uniref:host attachment protein n=1 Tax=Sulfurovum sp. TaxID=1969726 RepID=UPI0025E4B208|nr:host attachment protein [Sulfurovum sp.]
MKLDNTMIIVANLGGLKEYHVQKHEAIVGNEMKISYAVELHHDMDYIDAHKKLQDVVSDEAGKLGNSTGEEHNFETERKKRSIKEIADDINSIVEKEKPRQLFLAFPQELNAQLLEALSSNTKSILVKNVSSDLVKTKKGEILSHFE